MLLGVAVGLGVHLMVMCVVPNKPLLHASEGKFCSLAPGSPLAKISKGRAWCKAINFAIS